jgi:hypothetical protein
MLIALLAVLGVDLIVIVALLVFVISRKRWVKQRPGVFKGAIRVADGEVDGLGPKWRRGYGRWIRDVLIWTKAPLLFRNELVPGDSLIRDRPADRDELKRLDEPVLIEVATGAAIVEIAANGEQHEPLRGPYGAE